MFHNGKEIAYASPHAALKAGIAMVFQETSLVPSMTVAQNLYLGTKSSSTGCAAPISRPSNSCSR